MSDIVGYCKSSVRRNLKYVKLDIGSLRLILFSDAAFANAKNERSKLCFVLLLANKFDRFNILHYGSIKCKRVARYVMVAEITALVYGFDTSFVVKHTVNTGVAQVGTLMGGCLRLRRGRDEKTEVLYRERKYI